MKKKTIIIVCCLAALSVTGAAVALRMLGTPETEQVAAQPTLVPVTAQAPDTGSITLTSQFIGTVQPDQMVKVFPKVSGTVLKTYFEVGQPVKKGDLLYEIDGETIALQVNAAAAGVETAKIQADQTLGSGYEARVQQAQAAMDSAQKQLNTARQNLKSYNDNYDDALLQLEKAINKLKAEIASLSSKPELTEEEKAQLAKLEVELSVSQANYKDVENDDDPTLRNLRTVFQNAQLGYDSAKQAYELLVGDSRKDTEALVDAQLRQSQAGFEATAKQLEYTKVYAPIDGIVEQKAISEHDMTTPQAPAYTVSNKSMMTVNFSVSESTVTTLSVGDTVEIEHSGKTVPGTILEVSTMVDPASGLFTIKASVDAEEIPLHTGSTVKLYAATQKAEDSILIPVDAVYYDEGNPYVYLLQNDVAVKTAVETGISDGKKIQVVSGINKQDQVITTWHPKLLDGVGVVLKEKQAPANSQ